MPGRRAVTTCAVHWPARAGTQVPQPLSRDRFGRELAAQLVADGVHLAAPDACAASHLWPSSTLNVHGHPDYASFCREGVCRSGPYRRRGLGAACAALPALQVVCVNRPGARCPRTPRPISPWLAAPSAPAGHCVVVDASLRPSVMPLTWPPTAAPCTLPWPTPTSSRPATKTWNAWPTARHHGTWSAVHATYGWTYQPPGPSAGPHASAPTGHGCCTSRGQVLRPRGPATCPCGRHREGAGERLSGGACWPAAPVSSQRVLAPFARCVGRWSRRRHRQQALRHALASRQPVRIDDRAGVCAAARWEAAVDWAHKHPARRRRSPAAAS